MKFTWSIVTICCFLLGQFSVHAQQNQPVQTLFDNGDSSRETQVGFWLAPKVGFTQLDGGFATLANLRAGVTFQEQFSVGLYFSSAINDVRPSSEPLPSLYLDYWTVGGFLEYTLWSHKLVHLSFPLYIGLGEVEMDSDDGDVGLGEANFFQIEPSALLEVNVHPNIRVNLGAGYRFIGSMNYRNIDQSDLAGFTGYLGFKVGLFD